MKTALLFSVLLKLQIHTYVFWSLIEKKILYIHTTLHVVFYTLQYYLEIHLGVN